MPRAPRDSDLKRLRQEAILEFLSRSFCVSARSQQPSRFTLNARAAGITLAAILTGHWVRTAVERFDWKTRAALRKKSRKSWDAVRQMIRYSEVVGGDEAISVQALERSDLFRDGLQQPKSPHKSK